MRGSFRQQTKVQPALLFRRPLETAAVGRAGVGEGERAIGRELVTNAVQLGRSHSSPSGRA